MVRNDYSVLYKNEESFSKAFKQSAPNGLYFLFGSENYLIDIWAKKIISAVCGDDSAFNFQKLDGKSFNIDMLFDATEAMPLMAAEKCVLLDDLDAKINTEQQKGLEELFADLNPACILIVTAKSPAFDPRAAGAKKLIKLAETYGSAVELGSRSAQGLQAFVKSLAKRCGCEASPDICRYILQTCENDMNTLSAEVAKICAYAGAGELSRAHVDAVAIPKIEARVFDLSKCILSGNPQRAMEILANLFYLRESPVAILSALTMSYADMYRARAARDEGRTAAEVTKLFAYKSGYRVQTAFSGRLSAAALRKCLDCLYDCDLKMKSTSLDDRILLEKAVVQLIAING